MKRVMIIGSCGAGKSTLASKLQAITGLPLIHLDQEYWNPNWEETPLKTWIPKAIELADRESWIIDGNYSGTIPIRLARADTIIFLDRSRWVCLYRVIKRILRYYGRTRPDMNPGCNERFDWEFLKYTYNFNAVKRPVVLERLEQVKNSKTIFTLRSDRQVRQFLKTINQKYQPIQ